MGMIAHYYQLNKNEIKNAQTKIVLSYRDFRNVILNQTYIKHHLDIDKSWLKLVEVFKDIRSEESTENYGEITFYGKEIDKNFQSDGLINFLGYEDVKSISKYLNSLDISNKQEFIGTFNSTTFTQFGKIDYSDSYEYLYNNFMKLRNFYSKCEQEESAVIVSIG